MQSPWSLPLILASAVVLFACLAKLLYDALFRYQFAVRRRIHDLTLDRTGDAALSLFKDINGLNSSEAAQVHSWKARLQLIINQSGSQCTILSLFTRGVIAAVALGLAGSWRAWWMGAVLFPVGMAMPFLLLLLRRNRRQRKLSRQLPEAFAMISRAVRAGQTVPAALQIIANEFDAPVSEEFALCYEQQNLGMSRETTLRKLAARSGIMELQIFVVAILVQARSGGNLVELLDNLALMIRKRLKLKDRVRALTGEGRMQALVLFVLPIAAFLGILVLAPHYGKELLERPWLLIATGVAQGVGALWIHRIVNFEF